MAGRISQRAKREGGRSQQWVVRRKIIEEIDATGIGRPLHLADVPRASLVVRRHVIDEAGVIIDKNAIQPGVAKLITPGMGGGIDRPPTNRPVPGDPHVVSAKTSPRLGLSEGHT